MGEGGPLYASSLSRSVDHQTGLWRLAYVAQRGANRIPESLLRDLALRWFGTSHLPVISVMLRRSASRLREGTRKPPMWHCLGPDLPRGLWTRPNRGQLPIWATPFLRAEDRPKLHRLSGTIWDLIDYDTPRPYRQGATGQLERR